MKLAIGQRILCRLAGSSDLTEQVIAAIVPAVMRDGMISPPCVRLESGRYARVSWIIAAFAQ